MDHAQAARGVGIGLRVPHYRQLIAQGVVAVADDGYGTLGLGPGAGDVLKGEQEVRLRHDLAKSHSGGGSKKARPVAADLDENALALFERLRAWRAAQAKEQGVPAYVVFGDATLKALATTRPGSLSALGAVSGIGAAKLERYGDAVLALLAA